MVKSDTKRKNITMSLELAKWYERTAQEMGVSTSSLMVMALSHYRKEDEAVKFMQGFEQTLEKVQQMQKLNKSK